MRFVVIFFFCVARTALCANPLVTQSIPIEVKLYGLQLEFDVPTVFIEKVSYYEFELFHEEYEKHISKADITGFLSQLQQAEQKHKITDRFLFQMIGRIAIQVAPDRNYQQLMQWFVSKKLGYTVAIGTKEGHYHFLPAYEEDLQGISFYSNEGTKYFIDNLIESEMHVGSLGVYPSVGKRKAFYLPSYLPEVLSMPNTRILIFYFKNKQYEIKLQYDYAYVAMYYGLPGLPVSSYTNSTMSKILKNSLHEQLDPIISSFSKEDAVRFLLAMVQYGMPYRTDGEQMGEEKYFLPDEFLHYHFADCEDKSIFFKRALEELLHLEVKILEFGKHVAPIVKLSGQIGYESININGSSYYYCETTGKGYQLGQIPDEFKNTSLSEWK